MHECPRCHSHEVVKNGKHLQKQRYRCKDCAFQFTRGTPRGRAPSEKALAVLLYTLGLSMNAIARLLKVSTPAVLGWIRNFAEKTYEKPAPSEAIIVELDEMWQYLCSKKTNSGFGRLIVEIPVSSLIGNAGVVIRKPSRD